MPKINYTNKQVAQDVDNPVAPIEIFSASDANQIKESVNYLYDNPFIPDLSALASIDDLNSLKLHMEGIEAAKASKIEKVIYADGYTDSFVKFEADGFNYGSAIYKALLANNFKNVKIILSNKRYFPLTDNNVLPYYENVSFQGEQTPSFKDGLERLENGTIIEGSFRIRNDSKNVTVKNVGIDAGKNVVDTYYNGNGIEGFYYSYTLAVQPENWGHGFTGENIIVLTKDPYALTHAFIVERINGVYLNNIRTWGSSHGIVIKSKHVRAGSLASYGTTGEGLIIKSGEITTITDDVVIDSFVCDKLPPETSSAFLDVPQSGRGIMYDGQATLTRVHIGIVNIQNSIVGIHFKPVNGSIIGNFSIGTLMVSTGSFGILRDGNGILANVNIGTFQAVAIENFVVALLDGTGGDNAIKIGDLTSTNFNGNITLNGIYTRGTTTLEINNIDASQINVLYDLSEDGKVIVNNQKQSSQVMQTYASESFPLSRTNLFIDQTGKTSIPSLLGIGNRPVFSGADGTLKNLSIGEFPNNESAITSGLSIGSFYRTGDILKVVH